MSKISTTDVEKLFISLVTAANKNTKEGKQEFIEIMKKKSDEFNKPINSMSTNGNTINHSIARAISKCEKNRCGVCIPKDAEFGVAGFVTKYGEAPYIVFKYINDNDDVKEEYKNLFSATYPTTKNTNEKKYTPLDFATTCNPEFAQYMTPVKSPRSSSFKEAVINAASTSKEAVINAASTSKEAVINAASTSKKAVSKLVKRATSSKRSASAKDEDLTIAQLKAKIRDITLPVRHYVYNDELDKKEYENSEQYKNEEKEYAAAYKKRYELEKILEKKTKPSFLSRARSVFGKKGGKTRKHKKTNKRRTYRRK